MFSYLIAALLSQQPGIPARGLEASGEILAEYKESVNDRKRRSFERAVGLTLQKGYTTQPSNGRAAGRSFVYEVPSGQEVFWVDTLKTFPFIDTAELLTEPVETSGVYGSAALTDGCPCFAASHAILADAGNKVPRMLPGFFTSMYAAKNGRLRVLGKGKNFLHFQVDHLRGEVIRDRNFWEEIEVYIVFFPIGWGSAGSAEFHVFLDGKYAASLGKNPPGESGFSSMESEFYRQENDYLSAIMVSVENLAGEQGLYPKRKEGAKAR
jgi:hypothetical protein